MYAFVPKNGAPLDMTSLDAISEMPNHLLSSYLGLRLGSDSYGLVLSGLEPNGKRSKKSGPPGVMQFSITNCILSKGVAIVPTEGRFVVVNVEESQVLQLEEPEKSQEKRSLILKVTKKQTMRDGKTMAHQTLTPLVMVVNQSAVDHSNMTILANELAPNIWSTDVSRLANIDHPIIETLIGLLDKLEDKVWESDMHGQPWQVQRLGREWKTYQSKASVAITAARMTLSMKPTATQERVRVLTNLHWQLQRSVEQAAQSLANWVGVLEAADQYSPVFSAPPVDWDAV